MRAEPPNQWVAIDQSGRIALFCGSPDAAVPRAARPVDLNVAGILLPDPDEARSYRAPASGPSTFDDVGAEHALSLDTLERLGAAGIFVYEARGEGAAYPYRRVLRPFRAAHVDAASTRMRALATAVVLPRSFDDAPEIQPLELVPCDARAREYVAEGDTRRLPILHGRPPPPERGPLGFRWPPGTSSFLLAAIIIAAVLVFVVQFNPH